MLALLGMPLAVRPVQVAEERLAGEAPQDMVVRLSIAKAQSVVVKPGHDVVVGSDTAVSLVVGDETLVLGKPRDREEVQQMLEILCGREHTVYTGYAVWDAQKGQLISGFEAVVVSLRSLTERELLAYIESGIGDDKAGAYAIQDRAFALVEAVHGCAAAAMGLPLCAVRQVTLDWGLPVASLAETVAGCQRLTGMACSLQLSERCLDTAGNG